MGQQQCCSMERKGQCLLVALFRRPALLVFSSGRWLVGGGAAHSPFLRSEHQCITTENLILPYAGQGSTAIVVPPSPAPSGHTHTFFFHFEKCVRILRKRIFLTRFTYIQLIKINGKKNNSLVLLRVFVAQALHVLLTHWRLTITLWGTDPIFQLRRL